MNQLLTDNNFVFIDNFLNKTQVNELNTLIHNDINLLEIDKQCPKSKSIYNYHWFLEILINKTLPISEFIGETVLPTYCYARIYGNGEVLTKHYDRPSCEVSVTVNIGSDHDWDFFIKKPNGDIVKVNLKPGQAVIYLGMIAEHWRDEFKGNSYTQLFLHYVRSRGPYWDHYFDRYNLNYLIEKERN